MASKKTGDLKVTEIWFPTFKSPGRSFSENELANVIRPCSSIKVRAEGSTSSKYSTLVSNLLAEPFWESTLSLETTEMLSDGKIIVNNLNSTFLIDGPNSKLVSDNIYITGSKIDGTFEIINNKRDIANLNVEDKNKLNIKTDDIEMFSKKAIYDKKKSTIELFDNVLIKRGNEIISGDYGIINTAKSSYKVSSNNSKKVKAIIVGTDE